MPYFRGHVTPPNLEHLIALSHARHARLISALPPATEPSFDSREFGWVGPIKDQQSCGSCHTSDTQVLTEAGWVFWPEYDWTSSLGTMNMRTGDLEFQLPAVQHIYDHDGPIHYYDGRSLDFAITPEHRMVWRRHDRPWVKSAVADLPRYVDIPHATTGWGGTELERLAVGRRSYNGDDFLALVAIIISCGHVGYHDDGNGGRNNITFSCFRDDRRDEIASLAYRLGIPEQASRPGVWYFRDGELAEWLRRNAYYGDGFIAPFKRVPALVKCASQRQIALFLRAFGDQHTQPYGGRRFYSSSHVMMDDLQELLLRIGKRGTIEEYPPRVHNLNSSGKLIEGRYPEFMLTERKRDALSVERENIHIDHYRGQVYCATVPNGTLITRRNKRVLISSNCWDFSGTGVVEIAYNKAGVGGGAKTFILSEQYTLSCGRNGGCNGDDNTTVLDWAKTKGLPLESDYGPYTGGGGLFSRCNFKQGMTLYQIPDWGFADSSGGQGVTPVQDIKNAIKAYGAVGCGIAANSAFESWGSNNPSFSKPFTGGGFGQHGINHDVILIGWHDDPSLPSGGYWILRNSWGLGWGVQGYAAIVYGANDVGTEAVFAIPPVNPNPTPIPTPGPTPGPSPTPGPTPPGPSPTPPAGTTLDQAVALVTQGISKGGPYAMFTGKALPTIITAATAALKAGWVNPPAPSPNPTPDEPALW